MSTSSAPNFTSQAPRCRRSKELGKEITELCGYLNAATYRLLEMIREFDRDGLWHLEGICSCAHWLNWKCGIGMNAAREKVRVANALGDLPKISASFATGELSYSKARAMTRVATPDNEDYLLQIAKHGTAYHVEKLVQKYRRVKRLQETDDAAKQHDERSLHIFHEPDGSMVINVRLPAERGALVVKAIEQAMEYRVEPAVHQEDQFADEKITETDVSAETPVERESFDKRRVDALTDIAESFLANGPAPSSSADRFQVVLHVSAETLTNNGGELSHLEGGPHVSAETSRRLCCDVGISVLSEDEDGTLLNIDRKTRLIPPAMRRALRSRDESCRFPGCTHRHYIDGHHIRHWSDGGETSLGNLVQLCRHHHRLVHEGGFSCSKNREGKIEIRNTDGMLIARTGYIPEYSPTFELSEYMRNRYQDLFIDANTCVPKYEYGGIDWDLAIGAMFH